MPKMKFLLPIIARLPASSFFVRARAADPWFPCVGRARRSGRHPDEGASVQRQSGARFRIAQTPTAVSRIRATAR